MGCDTHMYVEYKKDSDSSWRSFGGRINPGRNYWMFGLMSKGVRVDFQNGIEPKGLPSDMGWHSSYESKLSISESEDDNSCTLEQAKRYEEYGCVIEYQNDKPAYVSHPDWHSHTWLSVSEFESIIDNYDSLKETEPEPEYHALLSAMKKLSEFKYQVRVVIWFDN